MLSEHQIVSFAISLRKLSKDSKKRPLKALFYFPDENSTGIAPTRLIVEKDRDLTEGMKVTVNWQGEKVLAEILALNGNLALKVFMLILCTSHTHIDPRILISQFSTSALQYMYLLQLKLSIFLS